MIKHLLNQSVTIYRATGYSGEGLETWDTGTTTTARIEKSPKQKLLPNRTVLTIDAKAFVAKGEAVEVGDRVKYGNDDYKVQYKHEAVDDLGKISHLELDLVRWVS